MRRVFVNHKSLRGTYLPNAMRLNTHLARTPGISFAATWICSNKRQMRLRVAPVSIDEALRLASQPAWSSQRFDYNLSAMALISVTMIGYLAYSATLP